MWPLDDVKGHGGAVDRQGQDQILHGFVGLERTFGFPLKGDRNAKDGVREQRGLIRIFTDIIDFCMKKADALFSRS